MARVKSAGNGRLQEALENMILAQTVLIQNQGIFLARAAETDARLAEMERNNTERFARIEERFTRIEERFLRIEALLIEHNRILQALPDAIREKIGFKPSGS